MTCMRRISVGGCLILLMHDILAKRKIPLHYYPEDLDHDIETLMKVMK